MRSIGNFYNTQPLSLRSGTQHLLVHHKQLYLQTIVKPQSVFLAMYQFDVGLHTTTVPLQWQ